MLGMNQCPGVRPLSNCCARCRGLVPAPTTKIDSPQLDHKTCGNLLHQRWVWNPENIPKKDTRFQSRTSSASGYNLTLSVDITKCHIRWCNDNIIESCDWTSCSWNFPWLCLNRCKYGKKESDDNPNALHPSFKWKMCLTYVVFPLENPSYRITEEIFYSLKMSPIKHGRAAF